MTKEGQAPNKWFILVVNTVVFIGIVGIPYTAMPVLFNSITQELDLTLPQMGVIWGFFPLGVAFGSLLGGLVGDRFSFCKVIGVSCFVIALMNGLRGLSINYLTLTVSMLLCGFSIGAAVPNVTKVPGLYFPPGQLGVAVGITNSGFNIGAMLSTALGATILLPLVRSWRNVLFTYSAICVTLGIAWLFLIRGKEPRQNTAGTGAAGKHIPFREALFVIFHSKDMWLLTLINLALAGSFLSIVGYLPTYLANAGLSKSVGDTISSTVFIAGIIGSIMVPVVSDRVGRRKVILILCAVIMGISTYLLAVSNVAFFWFLIPMIGFANMGAASLSLTLPLEMKGVGPAYGATALGLVVASQNVGGFLLPIIGGFLANTNQSWPFIFWAVLIFVAMICLFWVRETGVSRVSAKKETTL